ncbi:MAG: coproporphyrinogen dehydrogenase HemZ [Lachnospiraceae bacterium]|nr:coproporphyrinogen dehydrogenase HemZ [Lachnospiraceae bacterium]
MIKVRLNRQTFQYDVHSLVRAFYPREEVRVDCSQAVIPAAETCEDCPETSALAAEACADSGEVAHPGAEARADCGGAPALGQESLDEVLFELEICFTTLAENANIDSICLPSAQDDGKNSSLSHLVIRLLHHSSEILHMESRCQESDRTETKNEMKRLLYRLLSTYSGRKLPWGDLTGIRPTKIPMGLLRQGKSDSEIADYMQSTYYTSPEKSALAIEIANRELALLKKLRSRCAVDAEEAMPGGCLTGQSEGGMPALSSEDQREAGVSDLPEGYSLYIGIPFCPSICLYCSFSSSPIALWRDQVDQYLDALCHEIDCVAAMLPHRHPDAIYIGGGTPTTLEPAQMDRLLLKLEEHFDVKGALEFTVEAGRPDSITEEKLLVLKHHGVTRISINPQTMNQETLDFIGRRHTTEQTREAFYLARKLGFDNINMDLIVGLPGEGAREVEHTMQEISAMDPESLTVHSLAVKRAARLRLFSEEHQELSFENSSEIMDMAAAYAKNAGLYPYYLYRQKNMAGNFENVGYAKKGCEGLYNILIMEEIQSIIALGAGAATKLKRPGNRIERIENVKDIRNYIGRIDEMIARKKKGLYE